MKTTLFAAALLLGFANAAIEEFVQTEVFGSPNFHEDVVLNNYSRGGLIAGWILYGIIVIVSFVLVFKATLDRSKEYEQNLRTAKSEMSRLGININEVDREFDELQKGKVKVEEQADLIEIALNEGKKLKSNNQI